MSTIGPNLFLGKYFEVLHSSAENIRDAKETQHLRGKDNLAPSRKRKFETSSRNDARQSQTGASRVPKRAGTKNSDNRSFKHGNRYSDKSAPSKKPDDNQLGFRGPKY